MAKIKLTGHASGTGILTVTAPNTSTDRTITLPDATATIATTTDVAARLPSITDGGNATAITINSSEQVGIGTGSPVSPLHLMASPSDFDPKSHMIIESSSVADGDLMGVMFAQRAENDGKAWFGTERMGDYGVSDFVFLLDNAGDDNPVAATDEVLRISRDGRGLSQFTAFMWCRMNGSGTPAVTDGHNVSSITDNATGSFRMNFTVNASNANYSAVTGKDAIASNAGNAQGLTFNVAYLGIENYENNSKVDSNNVTGIVFGDS